MTVTNRPDHEPRARSGLTLVAVVLAMLAAACSSSSEYVYVEPAVVQEVGQDLWQVELTQAAADRTGIETTEVAMETVDGADRLVIPYAAVFYHFDGTTWTYTNPQDLIYVRVPIEVEFIEGDRAVLTAGPETGSSVVTVGSAELYGVEFGIGK